jgi:FkbM family methyltransferase|tara:strand:+ start:527 stop:1234 length:708 start_codon:yes stop_codon:yes gene_type:complete
MIGLIKNIALFFFDIVDQYYHQKKIASFLKKKNLEINIFFDVGAHMGLYTDLVNKIYPNCKSFLFEPQSTIFNKVKEKYSSNNNVQVFNKAISDTEKKQNLYLNMHDLTSTLSTFDEQSSYLNFKAKLYGTDIKNMSYGTELVQTITLDKFMLEHNVDKIDLIKIDTEGHEFNVLKGLKNQIENVENILIEFHHRDLFLDYDPNKIHQHLIDNGFKLEKTFKFPFCWVDRLYTKG